MKIRYGKACEDILRNHPKHFTKDKRYKVESNGMFIADTGFTLCALFASGNWLIEIHPKNVIGGEIL